MVAAKHDLSFYMLDGRQKFVMLLPGHATGVKIFLNDVWIVWRIEKKNVLGVGSRCGIIRALLSG
jgi:hypothetical protein